MAEQRTKKIDSSRVWCPRELADKADSVAEAEMMSRQYVAPPAGGRPGGRGTCVSELQPPRRRDRIRKRISPMPFSIPARAISRGTS